MKTYTLRIGTAIMVLAFIASGVSLIPPNAFYGDVTIGGSKAPDGTKVTAEINGYQCAYNTTYGGGLYQLTVPADDPDTDNKEGGVIGETVVFFVSGTQAATYAFKIGGITELNLKINATTQSGRVVKTPPEAGGTASPARPPAAPPQVTPITTPATAVETPILPGTANETQAKGEQGMGATYILLIIAAAIIVIIVYLTRIKK